MKILILGSGGREHALVWKLNNSAKKPQIYCIPGNAGTAIYAKNIHLEITDLKKIADFAKKEEIDITFSGSEAPLIEGIADIFKRNGLVFIGPAKNAAALEGSKIFAKNIMAKYSIPQAGFAVFSDFKKALNYLKNCTFPKVIKADGPCLGKGVAVIANLNQGKAFLKNLMVKKVFGKSGEKVIIEDFLFGQEVSFMVATDGKDSVSFLPSQDHKRLNDYDSGPNTGGMGAYAPIPYLSKKIISQINKEIVQKTLASMVKEGNPYKGILYPGIILTSAGPKVLEFNCRFGDPETQPLMLLLKTDLIDIFAAINSGTIGRIKLGWHGGYAACVVLSADGYPGNYKKRMPIVIMDKMQSSHVEIFHSGTKIEDKKLVTSGGRVLAVTARGKSLKSALANVYNRIGKNGVNFAGMHYRKDIGQKGLTKKLWK